MARPQISIILLNVSKHAGQQKASEGARNQFLINAAHPSAVHNF